MSKDRGHFSKRDAEKLAQFYRQQGTRGNNRERRHRRRSNRGSSGGEDDGAFTCCQCTNSKLYFLLENAATIEAEKINYPLSLVSGGQITHRLKLTCRADGTTTEITLPALACEVEDCAVHDLTGTTVGSCDIGRIFYGNSSSCVPSACPSNSAPFFISEPFGTLPAWTTTGSTSPTVSGGNLKLAPTTSSTSSGIQSPSLPPEFDLSLFSLDTDVSFQRESFPGSNDFSICGIGLTVSGVDIASGTFRAFLRCTGSTGNITIVTDVSSIGNSPTTRHTATNTGSHSFRVDYDGTDVSLLLDDVSVYSQALDLADACGSLVQFSASVSVPGGAGDSDTVMLVDFANFGWS